ncbi:MAG: DVUA0089 family protein [Microbacteriaceae bacterium]|nr:DVUA0089 family protein [Burkholderiaceae bacterium]
MTAKWLIKLFGVAISMAAASASAQVLSGDFDNTANTVLVASNLGAASFSDAFTIANNVALYDLSVPFAGLVRITSTGFAAGGADPYFSLFAGSGGSATFLVSNYEQAFSTGGDFDYTGTLAAGVYRLAIGVFANLSFAENLGGGSLADGFTALGTPGSLGNASYRVVVATAVPEASSWSLLLAGLLAVGWSTRCKQLLTPRQHQWVFFSGPHE